MTLWPKSIWVNAVLAVLALYASAIFAGFYVGAARVSTKARASVQTELRLAQRGERFALYRECGGSKTHHFDLDTATLVAEPKESGPLEDLLNPLAHKDFLVTFIGGSTGALTWASLKKFILKRPADERAWAVFLSLVGTLSGYFMGSYVGETYGLRCNADEKLKTLADSDSWRKLAKEHLLTVLALNGYQLSQLTPGLSDIRKWRNAEFQAMRDESNAKRPTPRSDIREIEFQAEPLHRCKLPLRDELESVAARAASPTDRVTSQDVVLVLRFLKLRQSLQNDPEYAAVKHRLLFNAGAAPPCYTFQPESGNPVVRCVTGVADASNERSAAVVAALCERLRQPARFVQRE